MNVLIDKVNLLMRQSGQGAILIEEDLHGLLIDTIKLNCLGNVTTNEIVWQICRPIILSDNLISDRWHGQLVHATVQLMTLLGNDGDSLTDIEKMVCDLINLISNESYICTDEQFRYKMSALEKLLAISPITSEKLQLIQDLILKVNSKDWDRISVRRWVFRVVPKVLLLNPDFVDLLKTSQPVGPNHVEWLCSAASVLFSSGQNNLIEKLVRDNFSWKVLSDGLASVDSLTKKRSLYLLKRWTDFIFSTGWSESDVGGENRWLLTHPPSYSNQKKLWNNYFLVVETLDEKQVHIVKQVLGQIKVLLNRVPQNGPLTEENSFHLVWVLAIYKILFQHQNHAIVIWSVEHFLTTFAAIRIENENDLYQEFLCGALLQALNYTKLYEDGGPEDCRIGNCLNEFLTRVTEPRDEMFVSAFWNRLLKSIFNASWGPVPLFYVTRAIFQSSESTTKCRLDAESIQKLREFVVFQLKCQEPMIRGSSQSYLLHTALNWSPDLCIEASKNFDHLLQVSEFLLGFHGNQKILIRGTPLWTKTCDWINKTGWLSSDSEASEIVSNLANRCRDNQQRSASKIGFLYVLLSDALGNQASNPVQGKFVTEMLQDLKDHLYRPYASPVAFELGVLSAVLRAVQPPAPRRGKDFLVSTSKITSIQNQKFLLSHERGSDIGAVIFRHLMSIDPSSEEESIEDAILVLNNVCHFSQICTRLFELFDFVLESKPNSVRHTIVPVYVLANYAKEIFKSDEGGGLKEKLKNKILEGSFPVNLMKEILDDIDNREAQRVWGSVTGKYTSCQWTIILDFLESVDKEAKTEDKFLKDIFGSARHWLNVGGISLLVPILETTERILSLASTSWIVDSCQDVISFLHQAQRSVFELRKSDPFWLAFKAFASMAFSRALMEQSVFQEVLLDIATRLFQEAEIVQGIAFVIVHQIALQVENTGDDCAWIQTAGGLVAFVLAEASVYGSLLKRDQKTVSGINLFIVSQGDDIPVNLFEGSDHQIHASIRATALKLLFLLARDRNSFQIFGIAKLLCLKCDVMANGKAPRCFENSLLHLKLFRVFQMLVLLSAFTTDDDTKDILTKTSLQCLVSENQRPNIRYLAEWVLSMLAIKNPGQVVPEIQAAFSNALISRLSSVPAFLSVSTQVALSNKSKETLDAALKQVLPWTMAQHFGTRLNALLCFKKLFSAAKTLDDPTWLSQYALISSSIEETFAIGDSAKNIERIESDFYLSSFDTWDCFNLENIFYDMPRLSGILVSECIPYQLLEEAFGPTPQDFIRLSNENSFLTQHRPGVGFCHCRLCVPASDTQKESLQIFNLGEGDTIQKKITPWKDMMESEELIEDRKPGHPDLILVATLVDRPPNLGGLCRTSEILGVGQFVIRSSSVLADKEFQNLSVTSQNWIDILEVRREDLVQFMTDKKNLGYRLVGIEQTQDSTSLEKFDFPTKTLLLLGNEKEGIPVDLIQELDDCVEIPQSGVVRSLNVHVSGALVVWEYVRQSLMKTSL